jgi:DNA polymerase III subunit epsilon
MTWLSTVFGGAAKHKILLTPAQLKSLDHWKRLPLPDSYRPHTQSRYVVADVETTGLSLEKDKLISIGAVAVGSGLIDVNDAFEIVLRQTEASTTANILIHGIGGSAQKEGVEPADALIAFLQYIGKAPLVAYHARFDQTMIEKAMLEHLGLKLGQPWIDLAWLMPDVVRDHGLAEEGLDDWLKLFDIENIQRHNAVSDAYATAKLLQVAIAQGVQYGLNCSDDFVKAENARRWKRRAG